MINFFIIFLLIFIFCIFFVFFLVCVFMTKFFIVVEIDFEMMSQDFSLFSLDNTKIDKKQYYATQSTYFLLVPLIVSYHILSETGCGREFQAIKPIPRGWRFFAE